MRLYVREESPSPRSTLSELLCPDLPRAIAMTRLMLAKWLEPPDIDRMHLSTLVHQILSCLRQTGGMTAARLFSTLVDGGPFPRVTMQDFATLLHGLGEKELIEQMPQGELILAPAGERITSQYDFYASFLTNEEYAVRYQSEEIGSLPADAIPPVGEHVILAGRRWRIDEILPDRKQVLVSPAAGMREPIFRSPGGEIYMRVYQEMRLVLAEETMPAFIVSTAQTLLKSARALAKPTGIRETNLAVRSGGVEWFPWLGTRGMLTLRLLADAAGIAHRPDQLSIIYKLPAIADFRAHMEFIAAGPLDAQALAQRMAMKMHEKYDCFVPESLLDLANDRDRLALDEARTAAQNVLTERIDRVP